ncbi:MAG: hypothetical protein LUC85_06635 [Bacteroidales bacterium]|nr:hypothetical protein [Bacteroidales bacterium]
MKINYLILCLGVAATALMSGSGNSNAELMRLVEERDSLRNVNNQQTATLNDYASTVRTINAALDSLDLQESLIFTGTGEGPLTKEDVVQNLLRYEQAIYDQNRRIDTLENRLAQAKSENAQSLSLIEHLRQQIGFKNNQIAQLREELANKNVDIENLREQVESQRVTINTQQATITDLSNRNQRQGEALKRQDAMLNNGYVAIGTKADLQRKGILRGSNISAESSLDRTRFAKVDIRQWREINFSAKRPRIISKMPESSYEITTDGAGNFTLLVKNPADFWRMTNYLVIQTDY